MTEKKTSPGHALFVQFCSKYFGVIIQLAISMVLARLLTPAQYGSVAVVTVFTTFFSTLADVGVGPAIVQYDELSKDDCNALFSFTCLIGVFLSVLFCVASFPISIAYSDHNLIGLCCFGSLSILFSAFDMVPNGLMLKNKKFNAIAVRLILSIAIGGVVAIVLAWYGFGGYAIVANTVIQSAVVFILNFCFSDIRIGNYHFLTPIRKIFRYSAFQSVFSTVNYFARNLDTLVVGRTMGASSLGMYDKAYKLSTYPNSYLSGIVSSVLQPYLARYHNRLQIVYDYYFIIVKCVSLVGSLISCVCCICATELILVMYGSQWCDSIVLFVLLGFSVVFQVVNSIAGAVFQSVARTDYMLYTSIINTSLTVLGVSIGALFNNICVLTLLVSVSYSLHFITNTMFLVGKALNHNVIAFLLKFLPEVSMAICSLVIGILLLQLPTKFSLPLFAIKIASIVAIYIIVIISTKQYKYLKNGITLLRRK